jgi:uncharacterized protein (DUF779 family)
LKPRKCSKWISLFVIVSTLVSLLLMQAGMASATTLQPSINPAGGSYTTAQTVTIYNIASGDTAYYTTDGSNPETSSTRIVYTGPFTVYQSETVQAVGYDSIDGWSSITASSFAISGSSTLEAPIISPNGGSYTTAQTVSIGDIEGTAYYTTDGSNPESSSTRIAYGEPFTVYQSETINAVNYSSSGWSGVASAYFSISGSPDQSVNNSAQIAQLEQQMETDINNGQTGQATQILQQIQQLEAQNSGSSINGAGSDQTPIIYPDGGALTTAQSVTISNISGTAYYTTDGSNPETSSTRIAYTEPFTIYQSETVNVASQDQYGNWSAVASATFTIGNSNSTQLQSGYQQHGRGIRVFARGKEINFDTQPIIVNGYTLIPVRQIAEALGLPDNDVQWNTNGSVTVNNGSDQMVIRNNEQRAYLNGQAYATGAPAQIVNGRMMVPLRAISQLFNKNIQWDSSSGTITIN